MFCGFIVPSSFCAFCLPEHLPLALTPPCQYKAGPNLKKPPSPAPSCSIPPLKAFPFRPAAHSLRPKSPPSLIARPLKPSSRPQHPPFLHPRPSFAALNTHRLHNPVHTQHGQGVSLPLPGQSRSRRPNGGFVGMAVKSSQKSLEKANSRASNSVQVESCAPPPHPGLGPRTSKTTSLGIKCLILTSDHGDGGAEADFSPQAEQAFATGSSRPPESHKV
jgi:hypothetical protein